MVHGDCKSVGCYAMTDAYIEEIYILAREAFAAGQTKFHVQALPFRMTASNMQRHHDNPWYPFWMRLKEGYDFFEATGRPPIVKVCSKQYMVNVSFAGQEPGPSEACPAYAKLDPASIQTIEGVPPALVASLGGKGEAVSRPAAPQQPVMAASFQTAPSNLHAASAPTVDMSASPVISRAAPPKPAVIAATQAPKAPAAPVYSAPEPTYGAAPQTAQARAAASAARPVNYQAPAAFAPPPAVPAPTRAAAAPAPSYTASTVQVEQPDPNALQKLNRSGKGGKLPANDQSTALSPGDEQH